MVISPTLISIHAPREGGDRAFHIGYDLPGVISIHAPREGGDLLYHVPNGGSRKFQSTPPARGATKSGAEFTVKCDISIHAPREGGDLRGSGTPWASLIFQSTPPARGATYPRSRRLWARWYFNPRPPRGGRPDGKENRKADLYISIHAPREGGDSKDAQFYLRIFDK